MTFHKKTPEQREQEAWDREHKSKDPKHQKKKAFLKKMAERGGIALLATAGLYSAVPENVKDHLKRPAAASERVSSWDILVGGIEKLGYTVFLSQDFLSTVSVEEVEEGWILRVLDPSDSFAEDEDVLEIIVRKDELKDQYQRTVYDRYDREKGYIFLRQ